MIARRPRPGGRSGHAYVEYADRSHSGARVFAFPHTLRLPSERSHLASCQGQPVTPKTAAPTLSPAARNTAVVEAAYRKVRPSSTLTDECGRSAVVGNSMNIYHSENSVSRLCRTQRASGKSPARDHLNPNNRDGVCQRTLSRSAASGNQRPKQFKPGP